MGLFVEGGIGIGKKCLRDVHPHTSRKSAYVINVETTYDMIL